MYSKTAFWKEGKTIMDHRFDLDFIKKRREQLGLSYFILIPNIFHTALNALLYAERID